MQGASKRHNTGGTCLNHRTRYLRSIAIVLKSTRFTNKKKGTQEPPRVPNHTTNQESRKTDLFC